MDMETVLHRVRGSKHLLSSDFLISSEILCFSLAAFMQQKPWKTTEPKAHQLYTGATPVLMLGCAVSYFLFRMQNFQAPEGKIYLLFLKEALMCCSHHLPAAHKLKPINCTRHVESLLPAGMPPPSCLVQSSHEEAAPLAGKNPNQQQNPKFQLPKSEREQNTLGKQIETQEDKSCDPLALLFAA